MASPGLPDELQVRHVCRRASRLCRRRLLLKDEERKCPKCGSTDVRKKYTSFLGNGGSGAENRCAPSGGSGFG